MPEMLPASAVIATRNRPGPLRRTLESLAQSAHPAEIVIVDGSDDQQSKEVCGRPLEQLPSRVLYQQAASLGAATQRNQGLTTASQSIIWFVDDDVLFEPECVARLYAALHSDSRLGRSDAMITNQRYQPPGRITRLLYTLLDGCRRPTYAGLCIGPGLNLLPEDRDDLAEVVPVEWLNTTCTMYRREAMPVPPFDVHFTGYSLMEDLALSLVVGKRWKLANVRTARIFHDSQPGSHKSHPAALAEMELINRHYIMNRVLGQRHLRDYGKLAIWEVFTLLAAARGGPFRFGHEVWGKLRGLAALIFRGLA